MKTIYAIQADKNRKLINEELIELIVNEKDIDDQGKLVINGINYFYHSDVI